MAEFRGDWFREFLRESERRFNDRDRFIPPIRDIPDRGRAREGFVGPVPVIIPPAPTVPVGPGPVVVGAARVALPRLGVVGLIGAAAIEILTRVGDLILEREEEELEEREKELERLRKKRREMIEPLPAPMRRAPLPVFTPRSPQIVEAPDVVAVPMPSPQPAPASQPLPLPIPAPTIPAPSIPQPAPATVPATVPASKPSTRTMPGTFPSPRTMPLPGVFPAAFPIFFPQPRISPRPRAVPRTISTPRVASQIGTSRLTSLGPSVLPFAQTQPQQATQQCKPCRCEEELDEPRDQCWKKLVKEGITPRLDSTYNWVEIDCLTGKEL